MYVNPKAATNAKIASTVAAPMPEIIPENLPLFIVLCMHNTPTGPNGMEAKKPTISPFIKNPNSTYSANFKI